MIYSGEGGVKPARRVKKTARRSLVITIGMYYVVDAYVLSLDEWEEATQLYNRRTAKQLTLTAKH